MKLNNLIRGACLLMALALLLMSASVIACAQGKSVTLSAFENKALTAEINPHKEVSSLNGTSAKGEQQMTFVMVDITKNPIQAELSLPWEGTLHTVSMEGRMNEITSNKLTGRRGVFFGHISDNGTAIPVCLNVTYNSSGSLITVSVGAASETSHPEFFVYGDLTPSIAELNKAYAEKRKNYEDEELNLASSNKTMPGGANRSDNSVYLQGTDILSSDGHVLGIIATYAPHNNEQGDLAKVYSRMIGSPETARTYLINTHNYSPSLLYDVYVTDADINITAQPMTKGSFTAYVSDAAPQSMSETQTVTVPISIIAAAGQLTLPDLTISYTVESVEYTQETIPSTRSMDWNIYNRYGITPMADSLSVLGLNTSTEGVVVSNRFVFEGILNPGELVNASLSSSGYLTYEYQYVTTLGMATFNFVTTTGMATATVTIIGD